MNQAYDTHTTSHRKVRTNVRVFLSNPNDVNIAEHARPSASLGVICRGSSLEKTGGGKAISSGSRSLAKCRGMARLDAGWYVRRRRGIFEYYPPIGGALPSAEVFASSSESDSP